MEPLAKVVIPAYRESRASRNPLKILDSRQAGMTNKAISHTFARGSMKRLILCRINLFGGGGWI
ncbi:hypothetical protein M1N49_01570 [Thermodesulfovibrionales bacterium]|nr:hypothetical protein [Thermodesulfovibrionales bacterium]MCL0072358.1 hypothetical protein [Thermodesulfovibrionales bacterium]